MPKWMKIVQGHYRRIDPANKMDINIYLNKSDKNDIKMIEMIFPSSKSTNSFIWKNNVIWEKNKHADGSHYMAIKYPAINFISPKSNPVV